MEDARREQFFEDARAEAQREFEKDGQNAQALVRWGGALLELAHYKQGHESLTLIEQAIVKLQSALAIDPERLEADWILGNALTSLGFLCADKDKAQEQFDKAEASFQRCNSKEPHNPHYKKALEMCKKAPEYYDEIQTQIQQQMQASDAATALGGDGARGKEAPGSYDFLWDVAGWLVLGGFIIAGLAFARGQAAPTAK